MYTCVPACRHVHHLQYQAARKDRMEPVAQDVFYDTYVEIEKITDGAEYMGPANAEEDEDDDEEGYVGEVVDPAALQQR